MLAGIEALVTALLPLGAKLIESGGIELALKSLTLPQWGEIAGAVGQLVAPKAMQTLETRDPTLTEFLKNIVEHGPDAAAKLAFQMWTSANADEAMKLQPGMGTDY